jgi:hypothetical protein
VHKVGGALRVQKAGLSLRAKKLTAAISGAQQAESWAPESARVNAMWDKLDANGRPEEATAFYQKGMTLTKTTESTFQRSSVPSLEQRLGTMQK